MTPERKRLLNAKDLAQKDQIDAARHEGRRILPPEFLETHEAMLDIMSMMQSPSWFLEEMQKTQ